MGYVVKLDLKRLLDFRVQITPLSALLYGIGVMLAATPFFVWNSDEAPRFFGSVFAAFATVIAVLLTARMTRHNERAKESREQRRRYLALAVEAEANLLAVYTELKSIATQLADYAQRIETGKISAMPLKIWAPILDGATTPLRTKVQEEVGQFPVDVSRMIISLDRSLRSIGSAWKDPAVWRPEDAFPAVQARAVSMLLGSIQILADQALQAVKQFRQELISKPPVE